jgi:hypothetical protein
MGTYLNSTLFHQSLRIFQASMPIDTGNLRYNATTGYYYNNGFNLETGGDKAPYFHILQTWDKSPYQNNFKDVHFTPVYRFLQKELTGKNSKYTGYLFLKQMDVNYQTELKTFLSSKNENLEARNQLAAKYGG